MRNVTDLLQAYRECVRHIWNTYVRVLDDGERTFADVEDALFYSMVTTQIGYGADQKCFHDTPKAHLLVVPLIAPNGTPALWARGKKHGGLWAWQPTQLRIDDIELHFIDYFDWYTTEDGTYRDWVLSTCWLIMLGVMIEG